MLKKKFNRALLLQFTPLQSLELVVFYHITAKNNLYQNYSLNCFTSGHVILLIIVGIYKNYCNIFIIAVAFKVNIIFFLPFYVAKMKGPHSTSVFVARFSGFINDVQNNQ